MGRAWRVCDNHCLVASNFIWLYWFLKESSANLFMFIQLLLASGKKYRTWGNEWHQERKITRATWYLLWSLFLIQVKVKVANHGRNLRGITFHWENWRFEKLKSNVSSSNSLSINSTQSDYFSVCEFLFFKEKNNNFALKKLEV